MANPNTPGVNAPNPYPSGTEPSGAGTAAANAGANQAAIAAAAAQDAQSQSQADPAHVLTPATSGSVWDGITSGFFGPLIQWFNIAGAMILGIVLVVLGAVLIMRKQVVAAAFPEGAGISAVAEGAFGGGKG